MASRRCRGRFVPTPTPEEVVRGALFADGAGHALGYNASLLYPREGGIGELARRLARDAEADAILSEPNGRPAPLEQR
mgnify:CR=1 FL=1